MVETAPIFVGDVVWMRPFLQQTADQCKFWVVFSAMARHPNGNPVVSVVMPVTAAAAVSSSAD